MAAKKAATIRIHQLAKELGVDSKDIVAKCVAEDVPDIKDHMSVVKAGLAATIREWFSEAQAVTAVETAAAVDVVQARAKARKRSPRKSKAAASDETTSETATAVVEAPEPQARAAAPEIAAAAPADAQPALRPRAAARKKAQPPVEEPLAAAEAPSVAPEALAPAPAAAKAPVAPSEPVAPQPIMNVPIRPDVVTPAGPMLQQPKRVEMKGPKVIRVESPEVVETPRSRTAPRTPPMGRGGPRPGRGAGGMSTDASDPPIPGRSVDRSGSRRNKRRSASASEEGAGRTGRTSHAFDDEADRPFNWRQQDLLERENRLNRAGGFFKAARRDNLKKATGGGHRAVVPAEVGGRVKVNAPISIKDLSAATGVKTGDILKKLLLQGKMLTVNAVLDAETASGVMLEYNIELEIVATQTAEEKIAAQFKERVATDERRRNPVVTILGHVDHGKTSLLDRIRNANVAAGEAGGITQATSAFQVPVRVGEHEHMISFIDTPGHEAFTAMRARGAKVTDVVVLVVAADDGVMPQTVESINHAKAAGVPIVVALNKIDKPEATEPNIRRILGQLAEHELNPVEWGGSTEVIRTSATKGDGIQDLLEVLDYQAQLLDLKADYGGFAEGTVLEARMEEGRGTVANVMVQQGTLNRGDFVVVGRSFGRIRDILDDRGQRIEAATPSMPVAFSGINELPDAGDKFYTVKSLQEAEAAAAERITQERQQSLVREKVTLDNVFAKLSGAGKKELSLVVKGDVQGSVETLRALVPKLATEEIGVSLKHCAAGGVNESDVMLAETTGSIVLAFNVTASAPARKLADERGVDIRFYDVIYDLTDDIAKAVEGMLEPELKLEVLGHAEVRQVFRISRVGMVAGCYVTDGVIERNSQIRVTRGGIVIEKDRRLEQLKRFKDDAKEVRAGQECGMLIDGYDDIKVGDVLECYKSREVKRKTS